MAAVMAVRLRDLARESVLSAGGRGFVRFLSEGGALLVTDAYGRLAGDEAKAALVQALEAAGFGCSAQGSLLLMTPGDALLARLCTAEGGVQTDWSGPLHPMQALCARWQSEPALALTCAGRQLVLDALRLTWQGQEQALAGLDALRAQAAVMLRAGDRSGLRMASAILEDFCRNASYHEHIRRKRS